MWKSRAFLLQSITHVTWSSEHRLYVITELKKLLIWCYTSYNKKIFYCITQAQHTVYGLVYSLHPTLKESQAQHPTQDSRPAAAEAAEAAALYWDWCKCKWLLCRKPRRGPSTSVFGGWREEQPRYMTNPPTSPCNGKATKPSRVK